jgi:hypothetical protein
VLEILIVIVRDQFAVMRHKIDHDGRRQRTVAPGMVECSGVKRFGIRNAVFKYLRSLSMTDTAQWYFRLQWIAKLDRLGPPNTSSTNLPATASGIKVRLAAGQRR